ncbi:MAG TPA: YvrJ family protein [Epulopiscium sp.]|nr:YvrJ family protein [Candidatus Epulonipiscium sp.]
MQEMLIQIGNLGFPIVVSMYLLIRVETKIEDLTLSIQELTGVIRPNN